MCLIFNLGNGVAITCFWERWSGGGVAGRCGALCDLSYHSSSENSRSRLMDILRVGNLQCSFCFSLAEEHKHSYSCQLNVSRPSLSVHFLHFSSLKEKPDKYDGAMEAALCGDLGPALHGVGAWELHLTNLGPWQA